VEYQRMTFAVSMPVRIALLGCGAIGEVVAQRVYATAKATGYQVVAAVDRLPERAEAIAELLGVPAFSSLKVACANVEVDAVDIRLPHDQHAAAVLEALAAGCHVLVEKPLATTLADGREILAAAARSDLTVAVAENYPHLLAVQAAQKAIADGRVGDVVALRSTRAYRIGGVWTRDGWRTGDGPAAGILLDQGTHHTSMLRRLAGEVVAVAASGDSARDTVSLTTRFASGVTAQSLYSWVTPAVAAETEATVFGTAGRIDIQVDYETNDGRAVLFAGENRQVLSPAENYYDSHLTMVADWVESIRDRRAPRVTVADAFADLEVVLAAARSLAEGGSLVAIDELRRAG